jgi:hypothetical protein
MWTVTICLLDLDFGVRFCIRSDRALIAVRSSLLLLSLFESMELGFCRHLSVSDPRRLGMM